MAELSPAIIEQLFLLQPHSTARKIGVVVVLGIPDLLFVEDCLHAARRLIGECSDWCSIPPALRADLSPKVGAR